MEEFQQLRKQVLDYQVAAMKSSAPPDNLARLENDIRVACAKFLCQRQPQRSFQEHYNGDILLQNGQFKPNVQLITRIKTAILKVQEPVANVSQSPKPNPREQLLRLRSTQQAAELKQLNENIQEKQLATKKDNEQIESLEQLVTDNDQAIAKAAETLRTEIARQQTSQLTVRKLSQKSDEQKLILDQVQETLRISRECLDNVTAYVRSGRALNVSKTISSTSNKNSNKPDEKQEQIKPEQIKSEQPQYQQPQQQQQQKELQQQAQNQADKQKKLGALKKSLAQRNSQQQQPIEKPTSAPHQETPKKPDPTLRKVEKMATDESPMRRSVSGREQRSVIATQYKTMRDKEVRKSSVIKQEPPKAKKLNLKETKTVQPQQEEKQIVLEDISDVKHLDKDSPNGLEKLQTIDAELDKLVGLLSSDVKDSKIGAQDLSKSIKRDTLLNSQKIDPKNENQPLSTQQVEKPKNNQTIAKQKDNQQQINQQLKPTQINAQPVARVNSPRVPAPVQIQDILRFKQNDPFAQSIEFESMQKPNDPLAEARKRANQRIQEYKKREEEALAKEISPTEALLQKRDMRLTEFKKNHKPQTVNRLFVEKQQEADDELIKMREAAKKEARDKQAMQNLFRAKQLAKRESSQMLEARFEVSGLADSPSVEKLLDELDDEIFK